MEPVEKETRVSWTLSVHPSTKRAIERLAEKENNTASRIVEKILRESLSTIYEIEIAPPLLVDDGI